MGAMSWAVGIDIGTTNVKVALAGADGTLVASAHRALSTTRDGDVAEQDAEVTWQRLVDAVREITDAHPTEAAGVTAIGVCTQYSSIVPIDAHGKPVAPMVMWQDLRGTDHSFDILTRDEDAFMLWIERHGIPTVGGGLSLAHILHLQLDRPDVHARTTAYVEAMDYITARTTGRITSSQHSVFMYQLCDNRTLGATAYDDDLVKLSGVDPSRLPPLVPIEHAVGTLLPDVAAELGLPDTAMVYAGLNDTATLAIATGAFTPGRAGLGIGTTTVFVDEVVDFRVDLEHQMISMPGPFSDRYMVWAENGMAGKLLEHVLQNIVYSTDELGDHTVDDAFARLDAVLRATQPGAGGVLFLPFLNGSLAPGPAGNMRGGFVHMSLDTTRRDMVRAVVEGIAHNIGWLLPHVETFTGNHIDEVAFSGGAARSQPWCQILADIVDRPIAALHAPDRAVARATALLALQRQGELTRDDLNTLVTIDARYKPATEHREQYAARQVQFEAAFTALLPISEALT